MTAIYLRRRRFCTLSRGRALVAHPTSRTIIGILLASARAAVNLISLLAGIQYPPVIGMDHAPSQNDLTPPRASDLLGTSPFEPFLEFNRVDALDVEGDPRAWLESRLEEGKPLIIRGFKHPLHWDEELLSTNSLANFREKEEREEKRGNSLASTCRCARVFLLYRHV